MRFMIVGLPLVLSLLFAHAASGHAQAPVIVNNPASNPGAPAFRISSQPVIKLGGLNDDPRYEFPYVWQADITETGRLLLLPTRGHEIRVFDMRGQYQRTVGRRGEGPGEFGQVIQIAALRGDTIAAFDNISRRVTLFSAATGAVLQSRPDGPQALCCFLDGSSLTRLNAVARSATEQMTAPEISTWGFMGAQAMVLPQTSVLTTRGEDPRIPLGRFARPVTPGRGQSWALPAELPPFARTASVVVAGNQVVYGVSDRYEYSVYSSRGIHVRTVRTAAAAVTPSRADIDAARKEFMSSADTPEKVTAYTEHYSKIKLYTTLPAFGRILAEADGTVWVQNYVKPGSTAQWWAKFDATGKLLGTLQIPDGMDVKRFTRGYVLFSPVARPDGVATLLVHRIESIPR